MGNEFVLMPLASKWNRRFPLIYQTEAREPLHGKKKLYQGKNAAEPDRMVTAI